MRRPRIELLRRGGGSPVYRAVLTVKPRAQTTIAHILPEPEASLLTGMLLGVETSIPEEVKDAFSATGTTHTIAISGVNISVPTLAEPAPRQWFTDPTFDTCLVRVTDRANDLSPDDTSDGLVNEHSRVQSFNADGSRLLVLSTAYRWYLYDAHTLQPLGELPLLVSL